MLRDRDHVETLRVGPLAHVEAGRILPSVRRVGERWHAQIEAEADHGHGCSLGDERLVWMQYARQVGSGQFAGSMTASPGRWSSRKLTHYRPRGPAGSGAPVRTIGGGMRVTLDWLGVATFRLIVGDLVLFLDAYIDRVPAAPPVGLTTADVDRADYVLVGHSHFDHLWGAERIAAHTGATVIGSHETVRLLHDVDRIPEGQLIAVAGGEPIELPDGIRVRVFPSLHSCIWATMGGADEACLGDLGVAHQERAARVTQAMHLLHRGALRAEGA